MPAWLSPAKAPPITAAWHAELITGSAYQGTPAALIPLGAQERAWMFVMTTKTLATRTGPARRACSPLLAASLRWPRTSRAHRHLTELLPGAPVHIFPGNLFVTAMARHTAL